MAQLAANARMKAAARYPTDCQEWVRIQSRGPGHRSSDVAALAASEARTPTATVACDTVAALSRATTIRRVGMRPPPGRTSVGAPGR
ncbi:hypothetical protein ASD51_30915 [Streptomyces sp. Root55]|nr:hypothetical protein ASD51_30915 [Streptomyces sp. Root55]